MYVFANNAHINLIFESYHQVPGYSDRKLIKRKRS